jgi:prevent-host-death family protein
MYDWVFYNNDILTKIVKMPKITREVIHMETSIVTATDFKTRVGQYIDASGKAPVYITKHNRPVRVLIDIDQYEHLIAQSVNKPQRSKAWQQAIASLKLEVMDIKDDEVDFLEHLERLDMSPEQRVEAIRTYVMHSTDS